MKDDSTASRDDVREFVRLSVMGKKRMALL